MESAWVYWRKQILKCGFIKALLGEFKLYQKTTCPCHHAFVLIITCVAGCWILFYKNKAKDELWMLMKNVLFIHQASPWSKTAT